MGEIETPLNLSHTHLPTQVRCCTKAFTQSRTHHPLAHYYYHVFNLPKHEERKASRSGITSLCGTQGPSYKWALLHFKTSIFFFFARRFLFRALKNPLCQRFVLSVVC